LQKPEDGLTLNEQRRSAMKRKIIACIYCGNMADIVKKDDLSFVSCRHCEKETELGTYQELFDQYIDDKRRGAYAEKIMGQDEKTS
jgi:hypothetical protein